MESKIGGLIRHGSVVDLYALATSEEFLRTYDEIENAKNPHLYSRLTGKNLDDLGYMLGIIRRTDETDDTMRTRIKDWCLANAKGNSTALRDALLNLEYAANVTYVPRVYGCGTAVAYVLPKEYTKEYIEKALAEARERVSNVASPSLYIEYVVPKVLPVSFSIALGVGDDVDISFVKNLLEYKIQAYVNGIAPKEYMNIGDIERTGLNETSVTYFRILSYSVDNNEQSAIRVAQETETKLLLDTISWTEV